MTTPVPLFPEFEGHDVAGSVLKISTSAVLDLPEAVLRIDDIVQIVVEARVNDVAFRVHEPSGKLVRFHAVKPLSARLIPYNPAYDNGVA